MDYSRLIRKRYSVRSYLDKKIDNEDLKYILEAGRVAPTAANRQPQKIVAVTSPDGLAKIDLAANRFGAAAVLIICADHSMTWKRSYDDMDSAHIDASIVTDHMMLAAADRGLGSLWVCKFKPDIIRDSFGLPDNVEPVNLLCLGYADEASDNSEGASPGRHDSRRKALTATVMYEQYCDS
ncbi:MAG: nitroreductase family protein [Eubacteriales bacterium]|nr:nitroreductase family protein [Eubacteriales bacterium]